MSFESMVLKTLPSGIWTDFDDMKLKFCVVACSINHRSTASLQRSYLARKYQSGVMLGAQDAEHKKAQFIYITLNRGKQISVLKCTCSTGSDCLAFSVSCHNLFKAQLPADTNACLTVSQKSASEQQHAISLKKILTVFICTYDNK